MVNINTVVDIQIDRLTKFPTRVGFGEPLLVDANTVQGAGDIDIITNDDTVYTANMSFGDIFVGSVLNLTIKHKDQNPTYLYNHDNLRLIQVNA